MSYPADSDSIYQNATRKVLKTFWNDVHSWAECTKMLGHANWILDDQRTQCAHFMNEWQQILNASVIDSSEKVSSADLVLLLQIDSDTSIKTRFGENGMLYFWIAKQDLMTRRFDRVWCVMQDLSGFD